MARKKMPDALATLMAFLEELGFEDTAEIVQEGFDYDDSNAKILTSARQSIDWHWSHSDKTHEDRQAFAAARALIDETQKLLR